MKRKLSLHLHLHFSTLTKNPLLLVHIRETRYENTSYLEHGEARLLGQTQLLRVAGVGVVAVVVQPLLEDLDRVLGQVSPAPPGGGAPAPALLVLSAAGVPLPLVCAGARIPLPFSH